MSSVFQDIQEEKKYHELKERWDDFRKGNPHIGPLVYRAIEKDVEHLEAKGILFIKRIKIRRIFENIKWSGVSSDCLDGYVVNNDFYKLYAFQWQANNPKYAGVFEHRGYIPKTIRNLIAHNVDRVTAIRKWDRMKRLRRQRKKREKQLQF